MHQADEREAMILGRLDEYHHDLQELRTGFERDHRKLSRIERKLRDDDVLDAGQSGELQSMESEWKSRLDRLLDLGRTLLDTLDEEETDQLVDPRKAARYRRSIADVLRNCDAPEAPLTVMRESLARARRAGTAHQRRTALLVTLEASDSFIDLLQGPLAELDVCRRSLALRRMLRSLLKGQKEVTEELQRQRDR